MSEEPAINPVQSCNNRARTGGAVAVNTAKEQPVRLCGAKTRSGSPCRSYGMLNGRCRMHGGKATGAPKGNRNAWKHGLRSAEYQANRALLRLMRQGLELV